MYYDTGSKAIRENVAEASQQTGDARLATAMLHPRKEIVIYRHDVSRRNAP